MRSKYHNVKTTVHGIKFDSRREAEYYILLKNNRAIKSIKCQPRFLLQAAFTHKATGYKHRAITYVADFDVEYLGGRREIIDVKGMKTDVFKLKSKLFDYRYPDLILRIE